MKLDFACEEETQVVTSNGNIKAHTYIPETGCIWVNSIAIVKEMGVEEKMEFLLVGRQRTLCTNPMAFDQLSLTGNHTDYRYWMFFFFLEMHRVRYFFGKLTIAR